MPFFGIQYDRAEIWKTGVIEEGYRSARRSVSGDAHYILSVNSNDDIIWFWRECQKSIRWPNTFCYISNDLFEKKWPKLINDNNDSGNSFDCSVHRTVTPDNKNHALSCAGKIGTYMIRYLTMHVTWIVTPIHDLTTCLQKHLNWAWKNRRPDWYNMSKVTICHMWRPIH